MSRHELGQIVLAGLLVGFAAACHFLALNAVVSFAREEGAILIGLYIAIAASFWWGA
jgi:hypothetical protein